MSDNQDKLTHIQLGGPNVKEPCTCLLQSGYNQRLWWCVQMLCSLNIPPKTSWATGNFLHILRLFPLPAAHYQALTVKREIPWVYSGNAVLRTTLKKKTFSMFTLNHSPVFMWTLRNVRINTEDVMVECTIDALPVLKSALIQWQYLFTQR